MSSLVTFDRIRALRARIRALRARAIEAGDVNLIAACDAVLDWGGFDMYLIKTHEMSFRTHDEAIEVCLSALKEGK